MIRFLAYCSLAATSLKALKVQKSPETNGDVAVDGYIHPLHTHIYTYI